MQDSDSDDRTTRRNRTRSEQEHPLERQLEEAISAFIPSGTPIWTKTRQGNKAPVEEGWKDPENLLTTAEAQHWTDTGGNIGLRLGLDHGKGWKLVVIDVEEEGKLPNTISQRLEPHTVAQVRTVHGGLNRVLAVSHDAYNLLDAVNTKVYLDDEEGHDVEILTDGHSLTPPSIIKHESCGLNKDGCSGGGKDSYQLAEANPNAEGLTEAGTRELLTLLDQEPPKDSASDTDSDEYDIDLPAVDEELADIGEAILQSLQNEAIHPFNILMSLLQGDNGDYDAIQLPDDGIDRSLQELMALTRLHDTVVYHGGEEGERAKAITLSTFERYIDNHQKTADGQPRKWLTQGDAYRKDRLRRAVEGTDRGKFSRFLNSNSRDGDDWRSWTDEYSTVTYDMVRFALDLLTGKLDAFFEDVEDLRETAAVLYRLDLAEEDLTELLGTPPPPVQDTTRGVSGHVSTDDLPPKGDVVEVALTLDKGHNEEETYESALRRLRRKGLAAMACREEGVDYRYYPAQLPDPPDVEYVRCDGEKYEPRNPHEGRDRGEVQAPRTGARRNDTRDPDATTGVDSPEKSPGDSQSTTADPSQVQDQAPPEQHRERREHQRREAEPHLVERRRRSMVERQTERLNQPR